MRLALFVLSLGVTLVACSKQWTAPNVATFAGTITARSVAGANAVHIGSILVVAGPACGEQIAFGIATDTRLARYDHTVVPFDSLTLGRSVLVQYSGLGAMSCPPQFGADVVTLEPTR